MTKHHTKAPLPFVGQKLNFVKAFQTALNPIPADGAGWTIVDAFGGSGLPAHVAKHIKPAARVIYNDFDGYAERLHHIPDANRLRQTLAAVLADYPRDKHLDKPAKARVVAAIQDFNGYKDLNCLRSWLLFSSNQAGTMDEFFDQALFGMVQFLRLMHMVRPPFIFFSSTRSELMDYLDFLKQYRPDEWAAFDGMASVGLTVGIAKGSAYEDNMVYKF